MGVVGPDPRQRPDRHMAGSSPTAEEEAEVAETMISPRAVLPEEAVVEGSTWANVLRTRA